VVKAYVIKIELPGAEEAEEAVVVEGKVLVNLLRVLEALFLQLQRFQNQI